MVDTLTRKERSARMALIKSKGTKIERAVMSLVHVMGYRYRKHCRDLPGTPDMVFPSLHKVIFVHGCFWHGHKCFLGRMPKSRISFWQCKITGNKDRDHRSLGRLRGLGWKSLVIWECQLRDMDRIAKKIKGFLDA